MVKTNFPSIWSAYIHCMLCIGYVLCDAMCYVHVISHVHVYVLCNEDITKFIWIHFALMWDTCNTVYGCIMIVDVQMQPLLHFTIASSRVKLFFITLRTKQYNPNVKHNAINIYTNVVRLILDTIWLVFLKYWTSEAVTTISKASFWPYWSCFLQFRVKNITYLVFLWFVSSCYMQMYTNKELFG